MHYEIIQGIHAEDLVYKVNGMLEAGFQLHGSPFVNNGFFYQAVLFVTPGNTVDNSQPGPLEVTVSATPISTQP